MKDNVDCPAFHGQVVFWMVGQLDKPERQISDESILTQGKKCLPLFIGAVL